MIPGKIPGIAMCRQKAEAYRRNFLQHFILISEYALYILPFLSSVPRKTVKRV